PEAPRQTPDAMEYLRFCFFHRPYGDFSVILKTRQHYSKIGERPPYTDMETMLKPAHYPEYFMPFRTEGAQAGVDCILPPEQAQRRRGAINRAIPA
ncbi:MAG: hypothetical protein FWG71_10120, partial [Synergistaceae bacterium]|nr:hypothetical protein [Synergistaceae bacterium]